MSTAFHALSGNAQGALCTLTLLLLCVGLCAAVKAALCRAPGTIAGLCALPCVLCFALLCALLDGMHQGFDAPDGEEARA